MGEKMSMWREQIQGTATGTTLSLYSEIVSPNRQWYAARVSIRNRTSANMMCDVFIDSGGAPTHVYHFVAGSANVWSDYNTEVWLRESERLRFDFAAVNSSDVLDAHINGIKRGWG